MQKNRMLRRMGLGIGLVFAWSILPTLAQSGPDTTQRTGITDGQNTPAGTNVITGQEAPQSGATSGVKKSVRKNKKTMHKTVESTQDQSTSDAQSPDSH